eukprot:scaffold2031_cov185-Alexandrium_tamarense.AAC.3
MGAVGVRMNADCGRQLERPVLEAVLSLGVEGIHGEEANRGVDFILLLKHDTKEIGIKDAMPKAKVTASTAWYWLSGDTSEGRVTKCRVCGM